MKPSMTVSRCVYTVVAMAMARKMATALKCDRKS